MNKVVPQYGPSRENGQLQDVTRNGYGSTGATPVNVDDLTHELRQPLSTIESLACYLEMTSSDAQVCRHLQRIRAMVLKAHQILEQASTA